MVWSDTIWRRENSKEMKDEMRRWWSHIGGGLHSTFRWGYKFWSRRICHLFDLINESQRWDLFDGYGIFESHFSENSKLRVSHRTLHRAPRGVHRCRCNAGARLWGCGAGLVRCLWGACAVLEGSRCGASAVMMQCRCNINVVMVRCWCALVRFWCNDIAVPVQRKCGAGAVLGAVGLETVITVSSGHWHTWHLYPQISIPCFWPLLEISK